MQIENAISNKIYLNEFFIMTYNKRDLKKIHIDDKIAEDGKTVKRN